MHDRRLPSCRLPLPAYRILRHADRHTFAVGRFDFATPIDRSRSYVCPTTTPLYYAAAYRELTAEQARRYNQLTALCFGELTAFFEAAFERALRAVLDRRGPAAIDGPLRDCVERFVVEEAKHRDVWRRLAMLSEPAWYAASPRHVVRIGRAARFLLATLARRPHRFPVVVWAMLALEEHSMEVSRRCGRVPAGQLEPRYAAVYRAHLEEEVRHVQVDWHLLLHLMRDVGPAARRVNGWLFRRAMSAFFLRPTRAAVRVIDVLVAEHPELRPVRRRMVAEVSALDADPAFRRMMFSPESAPITFALAERFPEVRLP